MAYAAATVDVRAEFPRKLEMLFRPGRFKIAYGGRGGAKSWAFARALLIIGSRRKIRVLCVREIQKSIRDSVHKLLTEQIEMLGLNEHYEIQVATIIGKNGTEFIFEGLRSNASKIKSYEGIDICWAEEAQTVTKYSWDLLIPTIRKDDSEIWISFNPDLEEDATYQRFVVDPPEGAQIVKMTWRDNPWFPKVLLPEMEALKTKDLNDYLWIWEGECRQTVSGAIYAEEVTAAITEGRVTRVPYDPAFPVQTFWDLGYSDFTSIWFAQRFAMETRIIDFEENTQKSLDWYLQQLQRRPYTYGTCWLPPDAKAKRLGTHRTIEEQLRDKGFKVRLVVPHRVHDGIDAARRLFSTCWFDEKKTSQGFRWLRKYHYAVNQVTGLRNRMPEHDEASHAADAFRYMAMSISAPAESIASRVLKALQEKQFVQPKLDNTPTVPNGWMS